MHTNKVTSKKIEKMKFYHVRYSIKETET